MPTGSNSADSAQGYPVYEFATGSMSTSSTASSPTWNYPTGQAYEYGFYDDVNFAPPKTNVWKGKDVPERHLD